MGATCNAGAVAEFEMSSTASAEHHSPSHIQPECGETARVCSRTAESILGDGQCGCAAA